MKRVFSTLVTITLLLMVLLPASAESTTVSLDPYFMTTLDYTATQWYADNDSRTILATVALLDLVLAGNDSLTAYATDAMIKNAVYIGKSSLNLYIFFFGNDGMTFVSFRPMTEEAEIASIAGVSYEYAEYSMEGLIDDGLISSYHQVDSEDILTTYGQIVENME